MFVIVGVLSINDVIIVGLCPLLLGLWGMNGISCFATIWRTGGDDL